MDYQLRWPRAAFAAEAGRLVHSSEPDWADRVSWLLEDAFAGPVPRDDFLTAPDNTLPLRGGAAALAEWGWLREGDQRRIWLHRMHQHAGLLRQRPADRPLWHRRQDQAATNGLAWPRAQTSWVHLVQDLRWRGYLDLDAPPPDLHSDVDADPDAALTDDQALQLELWRHTGLKQLWPAPPEGWEPDVFLTAVEAVHDLVAWPRLRSTASGGSCYAGFTRDTGRAVYRHRTNQLLALHDTGLQLAAHGEDTGRLVRVTGDDRDELVQRALATPAAEDEHAVRHAIALFRSRSAGRQDKRSAVVALHRVLEHRRGQLKTALLRKDEGALFQIANEFDLRHRSADQRPDYDQAYLDWVFWWYLATVELTDRLLSSQNRDAQQGAR